MIICKYNSTAEFSSADWNLFHKGEFYFQYEFLKVVEQSAVNDSDFRFLTFMYLGQPKGAVVISKFLLQLDLLSGNPFPLRLLKKLFPGALQIPLVCCGLPVSFGQNHFCVLDDYYYEEILTATNKAIEDFAEEKKCRLLAWKEFSPSFSGGKNLVANQYFKFPSLSDTYVGVAESGLESYLGSLRSPYRRKIKRSIERMSNKENDAPFSISTKQFAAEDVELFYSGYLAVINRTPVKLEVYPKKFFELLVKKEMQVKILTVNSKAGSIAALLIPDVHSLNFILVSKEKKEYGHALYAELIRSIVVFGLENGYKTIKMGQTSYYAKLAAGAKAEPLHIYLKSNKRRINFMLKRFGNLLFPIVKLPELNPYK